MFLIPIVGGLLAGLLIKQLRTVLIITGILWLIGSGFLLGVTLADPVDDVTVGTWIAIAIGLVGFALAWGAHRVRTSRG